MRFRRSRYGGYSGVRFDMPPGKVRELEDEAWGGESNRVKTWAKIEKAEKSLYAIYDMIDESIRSQVKARQYYENVVRNTQSKDIKAFGNERIKELWKTIDKGVAAKKIINDLQYELRKY